VSEFTLHKAGSFVARDGGGTEYRVVIYARYQRDPGGSPQPVEIELLTDKGAPVDRVEKGHYTLLRPGEAVPLTSDDPAAP
jgi:hypothetical protein